MGGEKKEDKSKCKKCNGDGRLSTEQLLAVLTGTKSKSRRLAELLNVDEGIDSMQVLCAAMVTLNIFLLALLAIFVMRSKQRRKENVNNSYCGLKKSSYNLIPTRRASAVYAN